MSKQIEALKLALEALEGWGKGFPDNWGDLDTEAVTAIREALADSALDKMAENARELGLNYEPIVEQVEDSVGMGHKAWDMVDPKELAKAFHEALAEPPCKTGSQCTSKCQQCEQPAQQQEPVKVLGFDCVCGRRLEVTAEQGVVAAPASKPWVPLTEFDIDQIPYSCSHADSRLIAFAIEAKLKEKNQ